MSTSSDPILVVLFGKNPEHLEACKNAVRPEYEIIKTASSVPAALSLLPTLISPDVDQKVRIAIMGGGFSPADYETVRNDVPGAKDLVWVRPDPEKLNGATGPPPPEVVGERVRKCLVDEGHLEDVRGGKAGGDLWLF